MDDINFDPPQRLVPREIDPFAHVAHMRNEHGEEVPAWLQNTIIDLFKAHPDADYFVMEQFRALGVSSMFHLNQEGREYILAQLRSKYFAHFRAFGQGVYSRVPHVA